MGSEQQTDPSAPPPAARDQYNIRMLRPLARFVREEHGAQTLVAILQGTGLQADELLNGKSWISLEQMEKFFAQVYTLLGQNEDRLRAACSYRMSEAYGPLKALLWAMTPKGVSKHAMRNVHVACTNGAWKLLDEGRSWIRVSYSSPKPESRLLCLGRQANIVTMPTMWGLQPAVLVEHKCTARGDDCCEYHVRWQTSWRWTIPAAGLVSGVLAAWGLGALGVAGPLAWFSLPLLGGLAANALELARVHRANREFAQASHQAIEEIAHQESSAREEIMALTKRQQNWLRLLEEQIAERALGLEHIVTRLKSERAERTVTLRGFSHDMRNPLTVLKVMSEYLRARDGELFDDWHGFGQEHEEAVDKLTNMVQSFADAISSDGAVVSMEPTPLQVKPLTESLRRRMKAMVFGKDVRVSVFSSREAPEQIVIDQMVFDRILDNLMTNAAKYTDLGSIIIEVGGTPGFLTIKVSDTGQGIEEGLIERIFDPAGPEAKPRSFKSWGLGLSVVLRLLDRIGGRLEVMSKPGQGSTFWVYLPSATRMERPQAPGEVQEEASLLSKVVTIRKGNTS